MTWAALFGLLLTTTSLIVNQIASLVAIVLKNSIICQVMQLTLLGFWPEVFVGFLTPLLSGTLNLLCPQNYSDKQGNPNDNLLLVFLYLVMQAIMWKTGSIIGSMIRKLSPNRIENVLTTILGLWSWQFMLSYVLSVHTKVIHLWLIYPENLRKQKCFKYCVQWNCSQVKWVI